VDLKRLEAAVTPAEVEPFTEFETYPQLVKGYIGPDALGEKNTGIRYLLDPRVVPGTVWITGANEPGKHVFDLVHGRDFTGDGVIEAAEVRDGDRCPIDGGRLETARGIEIGHIFQLGRKYAEALGLQVLDESGKLVTVTMGSYGIGVSRAVAAVVEATYDDLGLCWPREVSPADVHVVATGKGDEALEYAERLSTELEAAGVRVLYDDRPKVSPGVKFKDAELLGIPTILVVGRNLAEGTVEIRDRRTGEREDVPAEEAVARVTAVVRA
jgi:prolyl-tRNA synthetase